MSLREPRPLRVLLVSNLFPSAAEPTRGVFTLKIAEQLQSLCDLRVVCPLPWFPRVRALQRFERWYHFALVPEQDTISGLHVRYPKYVMVPSISERWHATLMWMGMRRTVKSIMNEWPFDAINAQWLYPDGVAASWLARTLRVPLVLTGLGCDVNAFLGHTEKRGQILESLQGADAVTAVSRSLRDRMIQEGVPAGKISVIQNGVDGEIFRPQDKDTCRTGLALPRNRKLVLFVGQLVEVKGLQYLLDAADQVRKVHPEILFCLVGEGPDRDALLHVVQERRMEQHVTFAGPKEHGEIARWMGACDVFCLPSIREGCPNVVMEALASGRPVVATDVGGIPDVVGPSEGILVEARDGAQLAAALLKALARSWDAESIRHSVSKCTWKEAAGQYHDVLARAARRTGRSASCPGA